MAPLKDQLQGKLVGKDGADAQVADDCELIGLYFSAHWCPPCRGFTPMLAAFYKQLQDKGKKFEIVFISSDRDEKSFKEYYEEMPWLALKFEEREKKDELAGEHGISGIPSLILMKPDGTVADKEGRSKVTSDAEGDKYPWGLL